MILLDLYNICDTQLLPHYAPPCANQPYCAPSFPFFQVFLILLLVYFFHLNDGAEGMSFLFPV